MNPPTRPDLVQLDFDAWANDRLFDACEALDDSALDREFEMGLGSIRKSLIHNLGAMAGWTGVLKEVKDPFAAMKEETAHSIEELRAAQKSASSAFQAAVLSGRFDDTMSRHREEKVLVFTRGGICAHVMTHSMHHRAQCLNMLRHLGVNELPESSVFQWMMAFPPPA
ncbi:MAG: DinB family protein [Phycisphaerales bacterium]|jgi:uncharacterized damage-inducible protein DinB|nr:DinB family protein [Phycisphaerales bacterium]